MEAVLGDDDGGIVGVLLGDSEGMQDEETLGAIDGEDDGRLLDGAAVGTNDGAQLGCHVGSVVGSTVGPSLGDGDGMEDSAAVG